MRITLPNMEEVEGSPIIEILFPYYLNGASCFVEQGCSFGRRSVYSNMKTISSKVAFLFIYLYLYSSRSVMISTAEFS